MEPAYHDGDRLIYDDRRDGDYSDLINRECIVHLNDGRTYVKILLKGSEPGLWTLISHNASSDYRCAPFMGRTGQVGAKKMRPVRQ